MMSDNEIRKLMTDPKKILDFFVIFHRMVHLYEEQLMKYQKNPGKEKLGLADQLDVQVFSNKSQEVKQ